MRERGSLLRADSAYRICRKAWESFKGERFTEAEARFRGALMVDEENADALYGLGVTLNVLGNTDEAVSLLQQVAKINPYFGLTYGVLGDIFSGRGDDVTAFEYYAQGAAIETDNLHYKTRLIQIGKGLSFSRVNPTLKRVLLSCLETKGIDSGAFGRTWLSIIETDPAFAEVFKLSRHKDYHSFRAVFDRMDQYSGLADPFFLTGLGKFIVPDPVFERFCTNLRRVLLETVQGENPMDERSREFLASALSRYAFLTGYIFEESLTEQGAVRKLKSRIEKQNPEEVTLTELAVLGCYIPLYQLKKARKIAEVLPGGDHVSQIPKSQILDFFEMEKIRKDVPVLTEIEDETSKKVQLQFEEFPYPAWQSLPAEYRCRGEVENTLWGAQAHILVAGCGTGREALELAAAFPDSQVLGVDLSRANLSYALFKKAELGLENVRFEQGDILALGGLDERFDYIVCNGALAHLREPVKGWEVLCDLLKDGGVMRIGLQSFHARQAVNEARERIKEAGLGCDAVSIRDFRRDARQYLKLLTLKALEDYDAFYSVAECRDLLFPAQECQHDVSAIRASLEALGLAFIRFDLPADVLAAYAERFPEDPQGRDLKRWERWEEARPDTFAGMYRFWCGKVAHV